jgi:hypothetical protein
VCIQRYTKDDNFKLYQMRLSKEQMRLSEKTKGTKEARKALMNIANDSLMAFYLAKRDKDIHLFMASSALVAQDTNDHLDDGPAGFHYAGKVSKLCVDEAETYSLQVGLQIPGHNIGLVPALNMVNNRVHIQELDGIPLGDLRVLKPEEDEITFKSLDSQLKDTLTKFSEGKRCMRACVCVCMCVWFSLNNLWNRMYRLQL